VIENENNFIDVSLNARSATSLEGIKLVTSLDSKNDNFYYDDCDLSVFTINDSLTGEWQTCHQSLKLSDIYQKHPQIILHIFIWNRSKKDFYIDDFKISLREGNPRIYGLVEKF